MSTSCYICKHIKDGMVKGIFVTHDGMPDFIVPLLKEYYNTEKQVDALINFGSLRQLGKTPIGSEPYYKGNNKDVGKASTEDLYYAFRDEDYCYLWLNNKWYYKDRMEPEILDLEGGVVFGDPLEMNAKMKLGQVPTEIMGESYTPEATDWSAEACIKRALFEYAKYEFSRKMRAVKYYMEPKEKADYLNSLAEGFVDAAVGFDFDTAKEIVQEVSKLPKDQLD